VAACAGACDGTMSHLGNRISALVDGELGLAERDRLHAHLAACEQCRAEAAALRALKRRVGALGEAAMDVRLLARLLRLAEPGEPFPARRPFPGSSRPRPALHLYPDPSSASAPGEMAATRLQRGRIPRGRTRPRVPYVVAGLVSFAVVGVGWLSFVIGGGQGAPGPPVNPPVEMFTVEHCVTTGELPFANPAAVLVAPSPRRGGP